MFIEYVKLNINMKEWQIKLRPSDVWTDSKYCWVKLRNQRHPINESRSRNWAEKSKMYTVKNTIYDKIEKFENLSNKRIEFFVVCMYAMQMFSNSVQSESILILGKFSPTRKGSLGEEDEDTGRMIGVYSFFLGRGWVRIHETLTKFSIQIWKWWFFQN